MSLGNRENGKIVAPTPSFFGANPAEVPRGSRKGLRILAEREDIARRLVRSLDRRQLAKALISENAPGDILTINRPRVSLNSPKGLSASAMTGAQRNLLLSLIGEYVHTVEADVAQRAMERLKIRGIEGVHFVWAGSVEPKQPHYYRLHGSGLLVEYDNVQDEANYILSVWRDTEGDFGLDLLAMHYQKNH